MTAFRAASLLALLLKSTMSMSATTASTSSPTQNFEACSICGEDVSVGSFDECRIGHYMAIGNLDGFYHCDGEYFDEECIVIHVDYPHDACHVCYACYVCGKGRIVSRPADTINKLPDNSPDQWQYLNKYSCQELQESMNCFEHWTGIDFSPELIKLFEENCGCEDQEVCALCPPSHRLQYPRHFMPNYIVPGIWSQWTAPSSSNHPLSQWSHLPCGIVELRGTNRLIPSELCHEYQSMVENDQACGGCVPITPKLSTSPSSSPTSLAFSSLAAANGIKNQHGDNTKKTNQKENNSYHRGRFPAATSWLVASFVAVAVVVVFRKHNNNSPKEVTPEFELIGLRWEAKKLSG